MSSIVKTGITALSLFWAGIVASPPMLAQSGPIQGILQLNANQTYLGIQMEDVTASNLSKYKLPGERGVIVRSIEDGSPAEKAGLREDDVILEFAGTPVWSASQFSRLVQETPAGRSVELVVSRDGKRSTITAEIGRRGGRMGSERLYPFDRMDDFFSRGPGSRSQVMTGGRPRLGLTLQPLSEQLAEHMGVTGKKGVLVSSVLEGSPSAGKIRAGDVIIAVDGKEIREPEDLTAAIRDTAEGKMMTLKLIRDKKELTVEVVLPSAQSEEREGRGMRL